MDAAAVAAGTPVGRFTPGRATENWLSAGPLPPAGLGDEKVLAALRPQTGAEVTLGGRKVRFQPVGRKHAYSEPPLYRRQSALQGTGDIVPFFSTWVDPNCCSGPEASGLLYTVLDNNHDRVVLPGLVAPGVAIWLGGQKLQADQALRLRPGLYPMLVRVEPAYYKAVSEQLVPIATTKAQLAPIATTNAAGPTADGKKPVPQFRFAPTLTEVPHPPTLRALYLKRIAERADRLKAVIRDLPGSDAAKTAAELLGQDR
jgi:hypothetical protein